MDNSPPPRALSIRGRALFEKVGAFLEGMVPSRVRHRYALWQLQRERRRTDEMWRRNYESARKEGFKSHLLDKIAHEADLEKRLLDEEIYLLQTRVLRQEAEELFLPIPEFNLEDGTWIESEDTRRWYFSPQTIRELRAAIRKERKENWEAWSVRLTALTGLIGALIGLVSVWK